MNIDVAIATARVVEELPGYLNRPNFLEWFLIAKTPADATGPLPGISDIVEDRARPRPPPTIDVSLQDLAHCRNRTKNVETAALIGDGEDQRSAGLQQSFTVNQESPQSREHVR